MRFKLTLSTSTGEVLDFWNVVASKAAEIGDEFNLEKKTAWIALCDEVLCEMIRAEQTRAEQNAAEGA